MTIKNIAGSSERLAIFDMVIEEACRRWCAFIDEAPERKDGEKFAGFFYEVFEETEQEYLEQMEAAKYE